MLSIQDRDERALATLYDRYSPVVYSLALRVLGDRSAAEEVLQDVFIHIWTHSSLFRKGKGSVGGWLAVIARNRALDRLRQRVAETNIDDIVVSFDADVLGTAERHQAMERVLATLSRMSLAQRGALEMAYFEGLSHAEIAQKTGEPLGTIKARIRSALQLLRKTFQ